MDYGASEELFLHFIFHCGQNDCMIIMDGKKVADEIQEGIRNTISSLKGRPPCLAVIMVGEHHPSRIYINRKTKACAEVGIISLRRNLPEDISQNELLSEISKLNAQPDVDGILVQLPLPKHIQTTIICSHIDPHKDVDGFHPVNMGKLLIGEQDGFVPCTPWGIKLLLEHYNIETKGRHVVIVGRSNIVGKPMGALLLQNGKTGDATVSIANRFTKQLDDLCLTADIIIAAVGKAQFITANMVKKGAVVVDVGINKIEDATLKSGSRIVGDVDFEHVSQKCSYITPVPGGVGPMTIAALLHNTLESRIRRENRPQK